MLWSYVKNISYKIERAEGTSAIKKQVLLRNNPGDEIASPRSRRLLPESHPHRRPIPNFLTNGIQGYKMKRAPISKESAKGKFWTCVFTLTLWVMGKVTPTPLSIFSKENKMYGRLAVYGKSNGVAESQARAGWTCWRVFNLKSWTIQKLTQYLLATISAAEEVLLLDVRDHRKQLWNRS